MIATDTLISPADAQKELARRQLAAKRLIPFAQYVDPDQAANYSAAHLRLIAEYLEKAESDTLWDNVPGQGKKILVINTPPRHWKTSIIKKFVAWFVGKRVKAKKPHQIIVTSYGASLAEATNLAALETVKSKLYSNVFPEVQLSTKSQSMSVWGLEGESVPCSVATGVGGGLTGQGADCLIIDDPIKDRVEANSATIRQKQWEWWSDVARTRSNPGGFIVIVLTRWHPDDLVGRLLKQAQDEPGDERIVVLRLPALAETEAERKAAFKQLGIIEPCDPLNRKPGEALWPSRQPAGEHLATKRTSPRTFDSLFQGLPTPAGGYLIGREKFKMLPEAPKSHIKWCWATDWALKAKETSKDDPDFTVAMLIGLWTPEGNKDDARIVIARCVRGQKGVHAGRLMVRDAVLSGPAGAVIAGASNGAQVALDNLTLDALKRDPKLLNFRVKDVGMKGDKVSRAQPWLDRADGGTVYVVEGSWNEEFFTELESFPNGSHDDQVDAVSVGVTYFGISAGPKNASSKKMSFYG